MSFIGKIQVFKEMHDPRKETSHLIYTAVTQKKMIGS